MKALVSGLKGLLLILVLILGLFLLVFGTNSLNEHLQLSGWFGDTHRDNPLSGNYDEFWIWNGRHYLFFWSELVLAGFYVVSCIYTIVVLVNENKIFYD